MVNYPQSSCGKCPFPAINIYFGRGRTVVVVEQILNCRERAYLSAQYTAVARKGHIWQVLKPGSEINLRNQKLF